jgi:hypothetical protein
MDQVGIVIGGPRLIEPNLDSAVRQRLNAGRNRDATAFAPYHARVAVVRRDGQTLLGHRAYGGVPGAIEALLYRLHDRNGLVDDAAGQCQGDSDNC